MIKCKKCGCENQLGSALCSNCSAQLITDVFISYSRKDYVDSNGKLIKNNIISTIKTSLSAAGISYWFDEDGIYSGEEFASIITRAIRNSTVFLFVSSVNSNASRWTSNEIATAMAFKKPIIPFRIDDSPYNDSVMMKIISLDYIECKDRLRAMEQLIRAVRYRVPVGDSELIASNGQDIVELSGTSRKSLTKQISKKFLLVPIVISSLVLIYLGFIFVYDQITRQSKADKDELPLIENQTSVIAESTEEQDSSEGLYPSEEPDSSGEKIEKVPRSSKPSSKALSSSENKINLDVAKSSYDNEAEPEPKFNLDLDDNPHQESAIVNYEAEMLRLDKELKYRRHEMLIDSLYEKWAIDPEEYSYAEVYQARFYATNSSLIHKLRSEIQSDTSWMNEDVRVKYKRITSGYMHYRLQKLRQERKERKSWEANMIEVHSKLPADPGLFKCSLNEDAIRVKIGCEDILRHRCTKDLSWLSDTLKAKYNHIVNCIGVWNTILEKAPESMKKEFATREEEVRIKIIEDRFGLG